MPIRQSKKAAAPQYHVRTAPDEPEQHAASATLLPMEDIAFLAAWRSGLVPCPGAFLRVRQLQQANPGYFGVLYLSALMDKPFGSLRDKSRNSTKG